MQRYLIIPIFFSILSTVLISGTAHQLESVKAKEFYERGDYISAKSYAEIASQKNSKDRWENPLDPTPVLPGQYRIRVSSGEGDAYSKPLLILPPSTTSLPDKCNLRIKSVRTWLARDFFGLSQVDVMIQANTDKDFIIGDWGDPKFGPLCLWVDFMNYEIKLSEKDPIVRKFLYEMYSCKGGGNSKPLDFPTGVIKKRQIFKVSIIFDPPRVDIKGVKTSRRNFYPKIKIYGWFYLFNQSCGSGCGWTEIKTENLVELNDKGEMR